MQNEFYLEFMRIDELNKNEQQQIPLLELRMHDQVLPSILDSNHDFQSTNHNDDDHQHHTNNQSSLTNKCDTKNVDPDTDCDAFSPILTPIPIFSLKDTTCNNFRKLHSKRNYASKSSESQTGKKWKCSYCHRLLASKRNLTNHISTHTGDKPFECNYCKKRFLRKYHLQRHNRIHTGQKPYKCEYCDRGFKEKHHLVQHIRTHTGEKPFECSKCKKRFTSSSHRNWHIKMKKCEFE